MSLISLSHIGKHYGVEVVLDDVSFRIERGDHVALVGTNGAGKSTILRIIMGIEEPDGGSVSRTRNLRIAYLPQEPDFNAEDSLYDVMLEAFREAIEAQERLRHLEQRMRDEGADDSLVDEYGKLQALVEHTGYDYQEQIERVLLGLGLEERLWHMPVGRLSGGQRTRANLARTLLREADLLLLDEPTNYLDIPAVEWLETYLRDLKRAFLIVAHDPYLLDRVTGRTMELSSHHIALYDAPYSRYLVLRAERQERQKLEYEAQQRHIVKTEEFVRRYGAGQRSKEARGRQKRLDRLERIERPREESAVQLRLAKSGRTGDIVLEADNLAVGYDGTPLVRLPDRVVVRRGEKVAIIGANGTGKTTLLRTLVGALPALSGRYYWGSNTSIAYYSQTLGQLDNELTVLDEVRRTKPMSEEEARSYLGRFLFSGDDVSKKVGVLSGGERSRVALARLILEEPNVLVLDEPTNHLDIASRDALERVLAGFGGTLLFVSHDRALIDALAQEVWVVESGRLSRFAGNYSAYAGGSARPLDVRAAPAAAPDTITTSPTVRVRELEDEAETLAARLAEAGSTASLAQLVEMTEQYLDVKRQLEEAQSAWVHSVRNRLHSFSG